MSNTSSNLSLPYIQPSQAQKHVTHNEGMRRLDALVQLSVIAADQTDAPATPASGDRYILATGSSGAWAGQDGNLAVFEDTVWTFYIPQAGWVAWVEAQGEALVFDGSSWVLVNALASMQNLNMVGIQSTADSTNRLTVSSDATLFSHDGNGHQMKLNKATAGDTASLLFQTNWSGRAEMGTTGSDSFEIKVSPDGATFHQSIVADEATGKVSFPSGVEGLAPAQFGDGPLLNVNYIASKGINLVTNSTGLLGNNYNYPYQLAYDSITTPNLPASFCYSGYFSERIDMEELLSVDPNRVYILSSYFRQQGLSGDWSAFGSQERHLQYMGLLCLDSDQQDIESKHHLRYREGGTDSMTTLAAPLSPGDTSIQVVDASGWNDSDASAFNLGIIIFGYKNSSGYLYKYYSRIVQDALFNLGQVDKVSNTIMLNAPLPTSMGNPDAVGGVWPAGTKIANSSSGSSYKYAFYSGTYVPDVDRWYETKGYIGGVDTSGTNSAVNFPPGTAYVKPFWLPNYSNRSGGYSGHPDTGLSHKVWYTGVSVVPCPLADYSEIISGGLSGQKQLKVPVTDFAAGTISLAVPVQTIRLIT